MITYLILEPMSRRGPYEILITSSTVFLFEKFTIHEISQAIEN